MSEISFLCAHCGARMHRMVNEESPPSFLRCRCGAAYPLAVSPDVRRSDFPEITDEDDALADVAGVLNDIESGQPA